MTALAIICGADGVLLASDGAAVGANDGVLVSLSSKVEIFPAYQCMIAARGVWLVNVLIKEWFEYHQHVRNYDEFLADLSQAARTVHEDLQTRYPVDQCHFSLFAAGLSVTRDRFESHLLRTRPYDIPCWDSDDVEESVTAYQVRPLPQIHLAPTPTKEAAHQFGFVLPWEIAASGEPLNAAEYAVRSICAARVRRRFDQEASDQEGVGGFVQLTVLQRDRIETKIVHRWPDRIGEPIDTASGDALSTYLTNNGENHAQTDQA